MSDSPLTLDDFAGRVGATLTVEVEDSTVPLVLAVAEPLSSSGRQGGAFRLELDGPLQLELGQGTFIFRLDRGLTEIFIVPIARTAEAVRYEAIFF